MGNRKAQENRTVAAIYSRSLMGIYIVAIVMCLSSLAGAQKFRVRPMKIELEPYTGQKITQVINVINEQPDSAMTLDLGVVDITQAEDGSPRVVEPNSGFETSAVPSCREWIKLKNENIKLAPLSGAPVELTIMVPSRAQGFYIAGITIQTRPNPEAKGSAVIIRFLIPILIEIQGRPMRQKIELSGLGMEFREPTTEQPATTLVSMGITNNGGTYSRLKGASTVKYFSGEHWRNITTAEFKEVGIIPGVELNLKSDIGRSLPSGKYKVAGTLYVDGSRVKPLEKEIDFAGDPGITRAAVDAALDLNPTELSIKNALPGATRTAVIKVENASDDTVNVTTDMAIPAVLKGVAFGELKGEDLACAEWVKVTPEKFTLRGGARQNLRITAKMPDSELTQANYYALLGLRAGYLDGQSAGVTTALICVGNKNVEARPAASPMKLTIAAMQESSYVVVGRFGNVGNAHYFIPKCRATVTTAAGASVTGVLLSGKAGVMLPLEVRDFSGIIDFSKLAAGTYRLTAILEYAGTQVSTEIPIRVSIGPDEQRTVEIVKLEEQPEEKLGVEW